MSDTKKLNDEALENVTGGARRTVSNDSSSYSWVRSGPDSVYTTGYHVYSGGYDWYELDDGNYIAGSLIGY